MKTKQIENLDVIGGAWLARQMAIELSSPLPVISLAN